jgi:hypothetical protein
MTTMTFQPRVSRRMRLIAFAPALICVGAVALVASGWSPVPGASAAGSNVTLTGTVNSAIATDAAASGSCASLNLDFGSSWAGTPTLNTGGACVISYATNDVNGAEVKFKNNTVGEADPFCTDPDGAGPALRCSGTGGVTNVGAIGSTLNGGVNRFGIALTAIAGDGGNAAGTGVSAAAPAAVATAQWAPIPTNASAAAQLCKTTGISTTSTCSFELGLNGRGTSTQASGSYTGAINFATTLL